MSSVLVQTTGWLPDTVMQVTDLTDGPAVGLTLVQGTVAAKLPASRPWAVCAPDALANLGVSAGSLILVGVTNQSSPSNPSTPGRPGLPTTSFAPVPSPDLRGPGVQVASLWQRHTAWHGVDLGLLQAALQQAQQTPQAPSSPSTLLGEYLVPVQVWPSSKLPRGLVAISPALSDMLAAPSANTVLMLASLNVTAKAGRPVGGLLSQLQQHQPTPQDAAGVWLRLCYDTVRCRPASLPTLGQTAGSGQGPASSSATPGTPANSQGRGTRGTPKSKASPAPRTPTTGGTPAPGSATATTAINSTDRLGDWVLDLLKPSAGSTTSTASSGASRQLSDSQRQWLAQAARARVAGQVLLRGNLVGVPLLGYTLVWCVEGLLCAFSAGAASQPCLWSQVQPGATEVELLLAGDAPPPAMTWSGPTSQDSRSPSSATAGAVSAGVDGQSGRQLQELVRLARQAAEEAAGEGGATQAAADAAEQAVRTGWSASGLMYTSLGGVSHLVSQLRELITLPLTRPDLFRSLRVRPPRGVLLHGPPGAGKTVLARAAAGDAGAVLLVINGPDIISEWLGESEARLRGVFAAARALAPAIIFLDEIDAVAPARGGGAGDGGVAGVLSGAGAAGETTSRLVTALLTAMDGASGGGPGDGVVVVGATNRPSALDSALRRPGRLERELEVGAPPPEGRRQILETRLRSTRHTLTPDDLTKLADAAHGFVAADLAALVNEACMHALRRHTSVKRSHDSDQISDQGQSLSVTWSDFVWAQARVKPSALRELAVEIPRVRWSDVGGLTHVKQQLKEAVVWPFQNPQALARLGAVAPRGVLLFGPPGCSKTLLAKAVAAEAKLNFISIKGGELFSKYVGESEKAVAALFSRARASAPTIVFFDEIDSLAAARGDSNTGLADRVMAQLLSEMDGLQQRAGVVVLAATNRPDCVDPALLRPGRFDRLVYVPPPDQESRVEILKVKLRKTPVAQDASLEQLAAGCPGYTGADIEAWVREAALCALEEDMACSEVCLRHFQAAQRLLPPSAPPSTHMEAVYHRFAGGAASSQAAGPGPVFGHTQAVFG